jgi:uncharacterized membrane protein YeaQ/YmgE (transglycosylase-associated protein family)
LFVVLVAGGLALGALCTRLLPSKRTGGMFAAMWAGAFGTVFVGLLITELVGADNEIGLAALAIGPIYSFSGIGDFFSGGVSSSTWGDSGGDCGDSGGDGDGGGCD